MPNHARVLKVMIASPSDVQAERRIIREAIHEWNAVHAADRQIVLLPLGWDTHAAPSMQDRPQGVINSQVLKEADLLLAAFWTRLGTPTGRAPSGTVEEIEEHMAAGKHAMIYFSDAHPPFEADASQLAALRVFRESCMRRGLCGSYASVDSFRSMLNRQLAQTVNRLHERASQVVMPMPSGLRRPSGPPLSDQAAIMLVEGSQDNLTRVVRQEHMSGVAFLANARILFDGYGGREHVAWEDALATLLRKGLVRQEGPGGGGSTRYAVTSQGFQVADAIPRT